jgi:hypothetical protein
VALVGIDDEGLVAFVNREAQLLVPELTALEGGYSDEPLPPGLRDVLELGDGQFLDIVVRGSRYQCRCSAVGSAADQRGRVIAITLERAAAPP